MALDTSDLEFVVTCLKYQIISENAIAFRNAVPFVWIGTGLAKIAASYGSVRLHQLTGRPSWFVTPLQFCQSTAQLCIPVLVSLRGANTDVIDTASYIRQQQPSQAVLITTDPTGRAAEQLKGSKTETFLTSLPLPPRDKRFVNLKSVIALSALAQAFVRLVAHDLAPPRIDENALVAIFERTSRLAAETALHISGSVDWQKHHCVILTDGSASPLALTWSSLLAESGVATASVGDLKDYTHGDHTAAILHGNVRFVVLRHTSTAISSDLFSQRLSTRLQVSVIVLKHSGDMLFWENLLYAAGVVSALSHVLGFQGSRPPRDPEVHQWRDWGSVRYQDDRE